MSDRIKILRAKRLEMRAERAARTKAIAKAAQWIENAEVTS